MSKLNGQNAVRQALQNAGKMLRTERLIAACRWIQRKLLGTDSDPGAVPGTAQAPARQLPAAATIEQSQAFGPSIRSPHLVPESVAGSANQATVKSSLPALEIANELEVAAPPLQAPSPAPCHAPAFTEDLFQFGREEYPYRLYIPGRPVNTDAASPAPMALIVLLHGCTQDAQDFARGTAMNDLAEKYRCMVLYPEQISKANKARCWNWFEPGHQRLDQGEPGMIAGLTQQVLASNPGAHGADPSRVYIAGLSAGGAMAAVVAGLYPDIFAALGVHSGLAAGAAQDMLSAFGAMRRGAKGQTAPALPTIVFHGGADKTVHPANGEHVSDAAMTALTAAGLSLVKSQSRIGTVGADEQTTERIIYRTADGRSYVEHWRVDAGPHAWSGGNAAGSYTDPDGPSASAAMLTFFLQHSKQLSS